MNFLSSFKNLYSSGKYVNIHSKNLSYSTFKCKKCENSMNQEGVLRFFCKKCSWPIEPGILKTMNIFRVFEVNPEYNIDKSLIGQKYKKYQFILHPDKHANKSGTELDIITSNSSLVSAYYNTLLDDKKRAKYLFIMKYGDQLFQEMISKTEKEQLEYIMKAHEKVESISSENERNEMKKEFKKKMEDAVNEMGICFENNDPGSIIDNYRCLSFYKQIYEKLE